jgi:hypothetical protein
LPVLLALLLLHERRAQTFPLNRRRQRWAKNKRAPHGQLKKPEEVGATRRAATA